MGRKKRGEKIFIERETSGYKAGSVTIINLNALAGGGGEGERVGGYWRDHYSIQTDVVLYLTKEFNLYYIRAVCFCL